MRVPCTFLLLLLSAAYSSAAAPFNVTLASVTLFKKISWFSAPAISMHCDGGKSTSLPSVNSLMSWVKFEGNESFQPILLLEADQCARCELLEDLWFQKALLGSWTVCPANFSASDARGVFTYVLPGVFHVNLACYECNHHSSLFGADLTVDTMMRKSENSSTFFAVLFLLGICIFVLFLAISADFIPLKSATLIPSNNEELESIIGHEVKASRQAKENEEYGRNSVL